MRIGIDVMGGDFAPEAIIEGAVDTLPHLADDDRLVLIGDKDSINRKLNDLGTDSSVFTVVHTTHQGHMFKNPIQALLLDTVCCKEKRSMASVVQVILVQCL